METILSNAILDETFVWTQNRTVAKFIEPFVRWECNPGVQTHWRLEDLLYWHKEYKRMTGKR